VNTSPKTIRASTGWRSILPSTVSRAYRRDFWNQQPKRVEVWRKKGTVRGVLAPILDEYGVGFRPLHGFSGACPVHEVSEDCDGRLLIIIYVGDCDPSGMYMSARDLPGRFAKYDGDHIILNRVALRPAQLDALPSFPASVPDHESVAHALFEVATGHEPIPRGGEAMCALIKKYTISGQGGQ
jgi:hypothetical protein